MTADTTASPSGAEPRAFVLLKSRRRLDLLNPDPHAWTDDDLAADFSRTMRWSAASRWEHPLSVAQHRLTVLTIREADGGLTPGEALRELLHDPTEFMLGCRSKRSSASRSAPLMRDCRARSTHAIDCRNGRPRLTRSTSAPTDWHAREGAEGRAGLAAGNHDEMGVYEVKVRQVRGRSLAGSGSAGLRSQDFKLAQCVLPTALQAIRGT